MADLFGPGDARRRRSSPIRHEADPVLSTRLRRSAVALDADVLAAPHEETP